MVVQLNLQTLVFRLYLHTVAPYWKSMFGVRQFFGLEQKAVPVKQTQKNDRQTPQGTYLWTWKGK
jgi:hypothetical protein